MVVAPIVKISPRANIGFKIFAVSIVPLAEPDPIILWISSINRIILPLESLMISRIFLSLSSKSPLYFAPATRLVISRENIILSFKSSGTSPATILWTIPSTMAVLPTPASPIKTGLFFILLDKILMAFLVSSSLPITGSSLPSIASLVRTVPYFSSFMIVSWSTPLSRYSLNFFATSSLKFS